MELHNRLTSAGEMWIEETVGSSSLRYYVCQPAPSQWVAVGLVWCAEGHVLLTGRGRCAGDAIAELRQRVLLRCAVAAVHESDGTFVGCAA
ncbi:MAG: hypothetical protein NZ696_01510 [Thermomicrobium sp.]|nr:hypothetical protein [Thermomicrobium sp.]MDW7982275.1 hypothetical protein [Thermomicrobium sp.]